MEIKQPPEGEKSPVDRIDGHSGVAGPEKKRNTESTNKSTDLSNDESNIKINTKSNDISSDEPNTNRSDETNTKSSDEPNTKSNNCAGGTGLVKERIAALRDAMKKEGLSAWIIGGSDPHQSEYVAPRWEARNWISGFSGSAGTVVISGERCGLWTDSRYFLQAEKELEGSGIELFREGLPEVPEYSLWLASVLRPGDIAGAAGDTLSEADRRKLVSQLAVGDARFKITGDLLTEIWPDRPRMPAEPVYQHGVQYAGLSRKEKLAGIRKELREANTEYTFIASLADIAWILNLRGDDIPYNPLFLSFLLIGPAETVLFIDSGKLSGELAELLMEDDIALQLYGDVEEKLSALPGGISIRLDPATVNARLFERLNRGRRIVEDTDISAGLKARKNRTEIEGLRQALRKDGSALVKFLRWFENLRHKESLKESDIADRLKEFRSLQDGFVGESFATIAGFRGNGAIIHYRAVPETAAFLSGRGLLLVDSGAHYLDGTTDITRVFPVGEPNDVERRDYTLVLKAHIALASAVFPEGTCGYHLEPLAKSPLWKARTNYNHGTGHGVGFFLNVHEGPQKISPKPIEVAMQPGMVTSNEPGLYRPDEHGIRLENLILTVKAEKSPFGSFLAFETLTLFPFEISLIDPSLLSADEKEWVNRYHRRVYDELSPRLEHEEREWLGVKCTAL